MIASKVKGREGKGDSDKYVGWREREREKERVMGGDREKGVGRERGERENKGVGEREGGKN